MNSPVSSRPSSPASSQEITSASQPPASGGLAGRRVTQATSTRPMLAGSSDLPIYQQAKSLTDRTVEIPPQSASKKKNRPLGLSISLNHVNKNRAIVDKLSADKVELVHGSNIKGLVGVSKEGSLLSANDIDDRGITLLSGERGYTQHAARDEPIRNGISMYSVFEFDKSQTYSKMGGLTPVMFGMSSDVPLSKSITEHPLSSGSVGLNQVQKIYIPEGTMDNVLAELRQFKGEYTDRLIDKIQEYSPIFN